MHTINFRALVWLIVGIALNSPGQESYPKNAFLETKVVGSYSIGLRDEDGFTNSAPDRRLTAAIWCAKRETLIALPHMLRGFYQIELLDTNGISILKTKAGKEAGDQFEDFGKSALEKQITVNAVALKKSDLSQWMVMFRPKDMFKIDKPGKYTLRIWFQFVAFPKQALTTVTLRKNLSAFPRWITPLLSRRKAARQNKALFANNIKNSKINYCRRHSSIWHLMSGNAHFND